MAARRANSLPQMRTARYSDGCRTDRSEFRPSAHRLVGLNGVGKSALLRIMACDLTPSSGTRSTAGTVPSGRTLPEMRGAAIGREPANPIRQNIDLTIIGPERISVARPNGCGKSTLLRTVAGDLGLLGGTVAFLDQNVALLDSEATILDNSRRFNSDKDENACRAMLAGFLFRADSALQVVCTLSGGQVLRAAFACRLGGDTPPEMLILDEPTNHLDLDSIRAIKAALAAFDGALLEVRHDEAFLNEIGMERRIVLA